MSIRLGSRRPVAVALFVSLWIASGTIAAEAVKETRSTRVQTITGRELVPVAAADDGAGGVVMLAHEKYRSTFVHLDPKGNVVFARQVDKIATPRRLLRTSRGYLVVGSEMMYVPEGVDAQAGFFIDLDAEGRPTRVRRLVGEKQVYLRDADYEGGRIAVLATSPGSSVVLLDEDLREKWRFSMDATAQVRLSAIAIHGDGVVATGAASSKCLVARLDARGVVDWANTYDLGDRSECDDVAVGKDLIYVAGSSGLSANLLALRNDGTVAYASSSRSQSNPKQALPSKEGVLVISGGNLDRQGYPGVRVFSRFVENPFPDTTYVLPYPPSDGTRGDVPISSEDLAWVSVQGRDNFFLREAVDRILAVSSTRDSWAEDCAPFERYDYSWTPQKLAATPFDLRQVEPAKLDLVDAKLPGVSDIGLSVADTCTGPVVQEKADSLAEAMEAALSDMPQIPWGPIAKAPVEELEKIKPVRRQWATLFRQGKWTELETLLKGLTKPDVYFENGRLKIRELEEALLLGSEELSGLDEESYFALIERWRKAYPSSERPDIQACLTMHELAWQARGSGYASTVTDEGWKQFDHYISEIVRLMAPLVERGTKDAAAYRLLTIAMGESSEDPMPVVRRAMKITPTYHHTYEARVAFLREQWGGSPKEIQAFLDELVGTLEGTVRAEAYARTVWFITHSDPTSVVKLDIDQDMVVAGFESIMKKFPKSTREAYRYAATMVALGNQKVGRRLFADSRLDADQTLSQTFFGGGIEFAIARLWSSSTVPAPPSGRTWEDLVFATTARAGKRDIVRGGMTTFVRHEGRVFGLTSSASMLEPDPSKARQFRMIQGLSWSVRRRSDRAEVVEVTVASPDRSSIVPNGLALAPLRESDVPSDAIMPVAEERVEGFTPLWVLAPDGVGRKIRPIFVTSYMGGESDFDLMFLDRGLENSLLEGAPMVSSDGKLVGIVVHLSAGGHFRVETVGSILSSVPDK